MAGAEDFIEVHGSSSDEDGSMNGDESLPIGNQNREESEKEDVNAHDANNSEPTIDAALEKAEIDASEKIMNPIPLTSSEELCENYDVDGHGRDNIHASDNTLPMDDNGVNGETDSLDEKCVTPGEDSDIYNHQETEKRKSDIRSGSGTKRARLSYVDDQPYVHIIYNHLSKESKNKLSELLQKWAEWHSNQGSHTEEPLESGDEMYFPSMQVGQGNGSLLTFWMDKPANSINKEQPSRQANEGDIPYYDRACAALLTVDDDMRNPEWNDDTPSEASRCFNCGSYSHSLKDCTKPRDNVAINNARNQHKAKRTPASGSRSQRYYQNTPGGKFDGIIPGVLGAETRQCLGIGEFDPPPWLHRMREIGYPPGYLEAAEEPDGPSGIVIYTDKTSMELEEGEIGLAENFKVTTEKRMTVSFPGVNAPIPENADKRHWHGPVSTYGDSNVSSRSESEYAHGSASSLSRGRRSHWDQPRHFDYENLPDDPPGTEPRQHNPHSSDYSRSTSSPSYPNRSTHHSSNLTRSASDSGHRSQPIHDNSSRGIHAGPSPRYGEQSWNSYKPYSPHNTLYSSSSPGRYSPHQSPARSERKHGWHDNRGSEKTLKREWPEDSHHGR